MVTIFSLGALIELFILHLSRNFTNVVMVFHLWVMVTSLVAVGSLPLEYKLGLARLVESMNASCESVLPYDGLCR
jgi:hypothetical protein